MKLQEGEEMRGKKGRTANQMDLPRRRWKRGERERRRMRGEKSKRGSGEKKEINTRKVKDI